MITLDDDIPIPTMSAHKRELKIRKGKPLTPASSLVAALKFISIIQKKKGPTPLQFCNLSGHWACASDGIITVGHPIEEDLQTCPQTLLLIDALQKTGDDLAITQLDIATLSIASGRFRALIPCTTFLDVPITAPDVSTVEVGDALKLAIEAVAGIAQEGLQRAVYGAVLLQDGSAVASDGTTLLECWHGLELPILLIPKGAAQAVAKATLPLRSIGYSQSSITFYFVNGAFIKTQLYNPATNAYPEYKELFTAGILDCQPVPDNFYNAVRTVATFSPDGHIFFDNNLVQTSEKQSEATTYQIAGLPNRMGFNVKQLLSIEHAFKYADFNLASNTVVFYGENLPVRGVLMGLQIGDDIKPIPSNKPLTDDDIEAMVNEVPF